MICELCQKNKATIHIKNEHGTLDICEYCRMEIQSSFSYYINGIEVVREEYENRIRNKNL